MSANSIDSDQYVDGSIDLAHMSANSIDSDQYVDASINTAHIANDQIDSQHYAAGSIDLEHMSSQSVDEDNLYISNAGSNGQVLTKRSGNNGGLTWENASSGTITALNNQAANRLVTIASTTTQLDGEANLTFDGNDLSVGQDVFARGFGRDSNDYVTWTDNTHASFFLNGTEEMRLVYGASNDAAVLHVDGDIIAYSTTLQRVDVATYRKKCSPKINVNIKNVRLFSENGFCCLFFRKWICKC